MAEHKNMKLSVANLGPIARAEIDLRPLTVFVGPSNTGKSYLAMLVYAMHKFFGGYRLGGYRLGMKLGERWASDHSLFGKLSHEALADLLEWLKQVASADESARQDVTPPESVVSHLGALSGNLSWLVEDVDEELSRCFGIDETGRLVRHGSEELIVGSEYGEASNFRLTIGKGRPKFKSSTSPKSVRQMLGSASGLWGELLSSDEVIGLIISYLESKRDDGQLPPIFHEYLDVFLSWVAPQIINPFDGSAYYLPADRTGVMHAHRVVVSSLIERASRAGIQNDRPVPALSGVLADFLDGITGLQSSQNGGSDAGRTLAESLESSILEGSVITRYSHVGYPEFYYLPQGDRVELPLINTSSMVSEIAPVVLYLRHFVQPGDTLIIEEPESHLHPALQVEFIRQLAAVVQCGVRVIITTHSEWVIDGLANLVLMSDLPMSRRDGISGADFALGRDEVGAWLFERQQRPKGTVVKEVPMSEEYGGFATDYEDVAIGTHNDWAEISNRIEESKTGWG